MASDIFQISRSKKIIQKSGVVHTTAEKLKAPEYSVDKTPRKQTENPDLTPKNNKR